ncbi:hypothetical protein E0T48_002709 [Enterococcus faecalis]|uniref:hypothetical protein n=1 Tax=Enterococcus faecalis TaxID=1351 RepID=UPI000CF731FF|nr:hypothetical protein [Enterococcus faecalis]EGO5243398.1 hypothetical protein [Enterococcus faecalis]EHK9982430.1 hypothetical protein [Enterococcus faecalis]PQC14367.1 hypothetical protein CUM91_06585 [Enterococcus faecalis]HAP3825338.1 hypothetical protein [Enterococcus faecalis]
MKKWMKMTSLGLLSFSVLGACGKEQNNKDSEVDIQSSTLESTEHTEEKESIIQSKTTTDYDTIYVQNGLVIGQTGDDSSSYNWTIYDTSLNEKNSILNADMKREELARSLKTGYSKKVNGTAVIENNVNENEIYSTYLDENAELAKTSLGERTVDNPVSLNTLTSGKYGIIPYRIGSDVIVNYIPSEYREKRFSTARGRLAGDVNENGYFTLLGEKNDSKTNSDSFVYVYDAKRSDIGDIHEENSMVTKVIPTNGLDFATNINNKNRLFIRQNAKGIEGTSANWTFYDLNSDTSFDYPSNISIIKFTDYGIETPIGDGEFLGNIGEAENYVFEDLNEKVTPDDSTPSSIDFTPRKKGIISSDGTIIKEPFAFEIKKPNVNGIAPYKIEKDDKYGLINVNTGEIIKEPFAYNIQQYNDNGLSAMTVSEDGKYSILDEQGNILEETEYIYISPLTNDNLASYREEANGSLGVLKVNG